MNKNISSVITLVTLIFTTWIIAQFMGNGWMDQNAFAAIDTELPKVSITSPLAGTTYVSPQVITISASSSDNVGVTKVEFYRNGSLISKDYTFPYSYSWGFTSFRNGYHKLVAVAYDAAGNSRKSLTVPITIAIPTDDNPPTIPENLVATAVSSSEINLTWSPSTDTDSTPVSGYGVYRNGVLIATVPSSSPLSYKDVSNLSPNTTYSYTVDAYDTANKRSALSNVSTATTLSVISGDTIFPKVTITSPLSGSTFVTPQTVTITASSSDNVGVTKVEFYRNGALYSKDFTFPYSYNWSFSSNVNGTHKLIAKAYDAAGNGTKSATVYVTVAIPTIDNPPSIPQNLSATPISSSEIRLAWSSSTDTVGTGLKGYKIYRNGIFLKEVGLVTSWIDNELMSSTTYSYKVSAVDTGGHESAQSPNVTATTFEEVPLPVVTLYDKFEIIVNNDATKYSNPFNYDLIALQATFTNPSGSVFVVDGFYDGSNTWKVRFMPNAIGTWNYTYNWSDSTLGGSGSFVVGPENNIHNRGHVRIDSSNSRYLRYDDGTPHYFFGTKWIDSFDYLPRNGKTDAQLTGFLDSLQSFELNGVLMKIALFPVMDDKYSWDTAWIKRGEWFVEEAGKRGIYVHINMFDTWGRSAADQYANTTSGPLQLMNAWSSTDSLAKKNYLRTIVARFGGFHNVYWELGNEMGHSPNSASAFVTQANTSYIPWIRQFDPYDLPIGVSEGDAYGSANVDINFSHQLTVLPSTSSSRAWIMNELVGGGQAGCELFLDSCIRNPMARRDYRSAFWKMFTYGGSGSSEASMLSINTAFNNAVLNVMGDHQRLKDFLDALSVNINETSTDTTFIISGPGTFRTRKKTGEAYVTYFDVGLNVSKSAGIVNVNLPPGSYTSRWFDPKTGTYTDPISLSGGEQSIAYDAFFEDIVLEIRAAGL